VPPRKRKVNTRTFRKTIYAVVEGEQTERQYVEFVRSSLQGAHDLQILIENPSSDPKSLFRRAKDILREPDNNPSSEVDLFLEHVVRVHNDGLPVGQVSLSLDSLY